MKYLTSTGMTEESARKYFADDDPIGKTLVLPDFGTEFKVMGVVEDLPHNSHFHFDFLLSMLSFP